jgi:hypothetical protein
MIAEQLASLTDLSNPFTVYLYVMIVAFIIRARLVLVPLLRVYRRYTITISNQKVARIPIRGILSNLRLFKRETSISGIEGFLVMEGILAIAPMLAAMFIRLSLGTPTIDVWDSTVLVVLFVVFGIWLLVHIKRSLDIRNAVEVLEKWYSHPIIVSSGLNTAIWSRRKLVKLSEIEIPEYLEYPDTTYEKLITVSSEDGKKSFDKEAARQNLKKLGESLKIAAVNSSTKLKQSAKEVSAKATIKLDESVQKRVDAVVGFSSSRALSFLGHLVVVLGPLVAIYGLN